MVIEPGRNAKVVNKRNPKNMADIGSLITDYIKNGFALVVMKSGIRDNH
jgi:hypothetical protein